MLTNVCGTKVTVLNHGGRSQEFILPGGGAENVVLKYDNYNEDEYNPYYSVYIAGRTSGMISGGRTEAPGEGLDYPFLLDRGISARRIFSSGKWKKNYNRN